MTLILILSFIMSFCFSLPLMLQPLSVGGIVLLLSLMLSISVFYESESWFGFVLFLIYIGGLLVMFAYVTALSPNLVFSSKFIMYFWFLGILLWAGLFMNLEFLGVVMEKMGKDYYNFELVWNGYGASLFSLFNMSVIIGLVIILLFVLICVVKICYFGKGALRPFK